MKPQYYHAQGDSIRGLFYPLFGARLTIPKRSQIESPGYCFVSFFLFLVRGPFVLHGFLAPNHTNSTPLHRLAAAWGEVEESEDQ